MIVILYTSIHVWLYMEIYVYIYIINRDKSVAKLLGQITMLNVKELKQYCCCNKIIVKK